MRPNRLRSATVGFLAAAAFAVIPSAASAGVLVSDAVDCETQIFSQPFLPWADPAQYTLQPGGAFEAGAPQWTLDRAVIADGNEPWFITAPTDSKSLNVLPSGSATTGSICVGIEHPDLRFFVRPSNPAAKLTVEVFFKDAGGEIRSAPIAVVGGTSDWTLTPQIPIVANLLALLPGAHTAVAFRFTASGGSFRIDDLYVDPMQRW
jgi:hypothetical protein